MALLQRTHVGMMHAGGAAGQSVRLLSAVKMGAHKALQPRRGCLYDECKPLSADVMRLGVRLAESE
eukprot:967-Chlamydomonas_euryale.AAC.2